jgi:chitodextrinase
MFEDMRKDRGSGTQMENGSVLSKINNTSTNKKRKRIAIIAVIVLAILALTWAIVSRTSGEVAALFISPSASTVTAGENFNVAIRVDTRNNNVVVVKSILDYDPADFELIGYDTSQSVFASDNTCVYDGKPCEIIGNDTAGGSLTITLSKPTPGVNTADGLIANLTLRARRAVSPSTDNLTLRYVAYNDYTDSDVIFDDGEGTDILSEVTNSRITAILPVPSGLVGTGSSATEINLTWDNPQVNVGVTGYKIFRNNQQIGTSTTNSFSDTGLLPQTSYSYKISAYNSTGQESTQTSAVSVLTLADTTKPSAPSSLTSSNITMNTISLSWNASTDDVEVTGYNVYRNDAKIGSSATTSFEDIDLSPETTYNYKVSAYDAAGNESDFSATISPNTAADTEAPTVPTNLVATAVSISQINLSWTASTDNVGVTGYKIFRNGVQVGTTATTTYSDTGLAVSTSYTYQVSAYDAKNNESSQSTQVSATTNSDTQAPSAPGNLTATPASMSQIDLAWTASTDNVGVAGYRIFRNGVQVGTTESTSYSDTGLTRNTTYEYAVRAYDAAGNVSASTPVVSAKTNSDLVSPSEVKNLSATVLSMSEIRLNWLASTDNVGVAGYNVYRNGAKIATTDQLTYTDSGLTQNTTYQYYVTAFDADGNESSNSNVVSATTLAKKYTLSDFANLVADWLKTTDSSPADVSQDGVVNSKDLGIMMSNWQ